MKRIAPITGLTPYAKVYFFTASTASTGNRKNVNVDYASGRTSWFKVVPVSGVVSGDDDPLFVADSVSTVYYASRTGGTDNSPTWGSTTLATLVADLAGQPAAVVSNVVVTSGAAQTLPDATNIHRVTLSANCTFTFPAAAAGKEFDVVLTQDATGSRLATWPATVKWAAGTAPTLTTTAAKVDVLAFKCRDGATWQGRTVGLNYS